MHRFIVNASIQVLPVTQDRHPYEWLSNIQLQVRKDGDITGVEKTARHQS